MNIHLQSVTLPSTLLLFFSRLNNRFPPTGTRNPLLAFIMKDAVELQFPFSAFLIRATTYCGAAIIAPKFLVSSVGCSEGEGALEAYIGSLVSDEGFPREVEKVAEPPEYNNNRRQNMDCLLVKLKDPLRLMRNIQPIPLSRKAIGSGEQLIQVGYHLPGVYFRKGPKTVLHYIEVKSLSAADCRDQATNIRGGHVKIYDDQLCTSPRWGEGFCSLDRGTVLVRDGELVGIGSWTLDCKKVHTGVFTRIADVADWIEKTMKTL